MSALFDHIIARSEVGTSVDEVDVEVSVIIFFEFNGLESSGRERLRVEGEVLHDSSEQVFILRLGLFFFLRSSSLCFFSLNLDLLLDIHASLGRGFDHITDLAYVTILLNLEGESNQVSRRDDELEV